MLNRNETSLTSKISSKQISVIQTTQLFCPLFFMGSAKFLMIIDELDNFAVVRDLFIPDLFHWRREEVTMIWGKLRCKSPFFFWCFKQICLWPPQAVPPKTLDFNSIYYQCWDLCVCLFNHVQSAESTTIWLQSRCRNILVIIERNGRDRSIIGLECHVKGSEFFYQCDISIFPLQWISKHF